MAKITQQSIDDLTDKLKKEPDLPAAEREFTKKEAVVALRPTIEDLRKRGFTLEQVAALLRKNGLDITFGSLRQYLADRQGGAPKRKKRAPAAAPSTPSATQPKTDVATVTPSAPAKAGAKSEKSDKKQTYSSFDVRPDTENI
jgi:hypothetical protein